METKVGLETMPSDWMGDLPDQLAMNAMAQQGAKGMELSYFKMQKLYIQEQIKNREQEWLLSLYREAGFTLLTNGTPKIETKKKPSQYFEEIVDSLEKFDEKLEKIYEAVTK